MRYEGAVQPRVGVVVPAREDGRDSDRAQSSSDRAAIRWRSGGSQMAIGWRSGAIVRRPLLGVHGERFEGVQLRAAPACRRSIWRDQLCDSAVRLSCARRGARGGARGGAKGLCKGAVQGAVQGARAPRLPATRLMMWQWQSGEDLFVPRVIDLRWPSGSHREDITCRRPS